MDQKRNKANVWYWIDNEDDVSSPALLVYPDRIENNIKKMISVVQDPEVLRPHVKTHKTPEIVSLQMKHGISYLFEKKTLAHFLINSLYSVTALIIMGFIIEIWH